MDHDGRHWLRILNRTQAGENVEAITRLRVAQENLGTGNRHSERDSTCLHAGSERVCRDHRRRCRRSIGCWCHLRLTRRRLGASVLEQREHDPKCQEAGQRNEQSGS